MSTESEGPDRTASILAGLLIVVMIGAGVVAKHDNPSWNKMVGNAKTMLGLSKPTIAKKKD